MLLLRVVAVYLLACFADLLDDDIARLALDDSLDRGVFVSRDHDEAVALAHHLHVERRRDLDRPQTGTAPAFAVIRQGRLHGVAVGPFLDPLVDATEDLLVASSPLGKVHRSDGMPDRRIPQA